MNETLYKMLAPTQTIENALPQIIEAFVEFYGEENRVNIEEKFNNLIIVGYGLPDKLSSIIREIKRQKEKELIEQFFDKIGIYENRDELRKLLFSTNGFDYKNLIPIEYYISYLEKTSNKSKHEDSNYMTEISNEISDSQKQKTLQFLKGFNPNVTLENMDILISEGAFAEIDKLIPIYKEMMQQYSLEVQKLDTYIKQDEENRKIRKSLENKYWIQLVNEFLFLFPKEEVDLLKKEIEQYGYTSLYQQKTIESYLTGSLYTTPLIYSFSEENEDILLNGKSWQKESVMNDRIRFFKNMGIDLGNDYELYKNNLECQRLIPPQYIIKKIESRKKELNQIMLNQYYKSTEEYKNNRQKIDSNNLLIKDDSYDANAYFNKSTFVSPNIINNEGNYYLLPLMCINMNLQEYLDVTTIHELNHVYELNLERVSENHCEFNCGWDIVDGDLDSSVDEVEDLEKNNEKRDYELFNEIINEVIAQEITTILHNSGNYIFNTKDNAKIKYGTSYEHTFFLIRDFYETYKKEIIETRKTRNMKALFDVVGKENFDALNSLFHVFYENFGGMKIYSVIQDLNNGVVNDDTAKFKQLIEDRNNILMIMQENKTLKESNQK